MITIISGTNRVESNTLKVAQVYFDLLNKRDVEVKLFALENLPLNFVSPTMYDRPSPEFDSIQNEYFIPANRFFILTPEYNGTFAGILKTMIDGSDIANCWRGKKVCLTGIASGRAGGLRAMDDLTNQMHHTMTHVYPNKLPFSSIHTMLNDDGQFKDERNIELIENQIDGFLKF